MQAAPESFCNAFRRVAFMCTESPDCSLLSLIMKYVSTYSVVTGLVKSVLEN